MKVPKYVRDAIEKAGKAFYTARENEKIIKDWLDSKGFYENDTVADQYIDCIEYGGNGVDTFIDFLENYDSGYRFMAYDWNEGMFVPLHTNDVVEAIYTAWNYEFDVYEVYANVENLIFSGKEDNDENNEMLREYGIMVIDLNEQRLLQNIKTREIYYPKY